MIYKILGSNVRSDFKRILKILQTCLSLTVHTIGAYGLVLRQRGGEAVLVNGAVFKTVSETVRAGSGRFDSYTPPPVQMEGIYSSFTKEFLT